MLVFTVFIPVSPPALISAPQVFLGCDRALPELSNQVENQMIWDYDTSKPIFVTNKLFRGHP